MNAKPKIIVVTGAARGLGQEAVRRLKATGATVIGLDIIAAPADSPADAFHLVDLADATQVRDIAQRIATRFGDADILVNNAGVLSIDQAESGVTATVRRSVDVNLFGPWQLTAELLPGLLRKRGRVVNVSSLFALVNAPHVAAYAAGKRALWAYSDVLRMQHRGRLDVVTVFPGFIDTPIHRPAEEVGLSVKRLVSFKMGRRTLLSLEEPVASAARGLTRACLGSSARNRGTTTMGTLTMYTARFVPSLVDAFISWRLSSLVRGGHMRLKPELIE
jgi:NAD(P)-dependent dehydrogenase (short-subunit alcohol dehydrogenase family)